jgi:serine/threonine-protein kinase
MPYVEGESLRDRLTREKQLPVEDALQIAREVADALGSAHRHDVIHRDIKPENILLEEGHAVVADFGIARAIHAAGGEKLTETGLAVGTPAYMSPEQAMGSQDLDGRSDLYSLGCVLYEMLGSEPPFTGATVESIVHQHIAVEPRPVTALRPAVPAEVVAALSRALSKAPADRFSPAAQFAEALAMRESGAGASGPTPIPQPRLRSWRSTADAAGPPQTAIAVLPFQNLSGDGPYTYFAGGLHDELLTQLAKVAALKVISRTSVMGYTGPDIPPLRQIASELDVGSVLEGSVQIVGDRLRVNVQLIDAATDEHLWAESYDRTLDDAFAIQSDVAQQVVAAVGAALGESEHQALAEAPTADPEAYRLYLQGRTYYRRPGYRREDYEAAQRVYERALALDSTFALAHAGLSKVHGSMWFMRYDPSPARLARQREAAGTALRLAPDLPGAHSAMGFVHQIGQDWEAALEEDGMALQGLPNDAELWGNLAYAHREQGNWDEVDAATERAIELDPRNATYFYDLRGNTYLVTRRYAQAVAAYDRAMTLAPDLHDAAVFKGIAYLHWTGSLDTLRAVVEQVPPDVELGGLGTGRTLRGLVLIWERDPDGLLALLGNAGESVFETMAYYCPTSLAAAWAHEMRGDDGAARLAFDAARVFLDSVVAVLSIDWRVHGARGLALAGLGRRAEALREARWLEQSVVYREDAYWGPAAAEERARILAQAGEADAALEEIERLLAGPASGFTLSVHTLRMDPRWDPLREHPRFQRLLEQYGN